MSDSKGDFDWASGLRYKIGDEYISFRRDGKPYVIRDAGILKAAHKLFEPQRELGMRQGALGEQQGKLGELQAKLGEQQARLGEEQAKRAKEATRQLKALIDEALKKGLVEPEPR